MEQKHIGQPRSTRALHEYKNALCQLLEERRERGGEIYN
jgi:deoxycytidylate deaminase